MKKRKRLIIIVISIILVALLAVFGYYKFIYDENKLSIEEKEWLNANKNSLITFNIPSELNVFGKNGKGVFYDFLNDFSSNYDISINKNIAPLTGAGGLGFVVSETMTGEDLLFFQDHYVIITKESNSITKLSDLNGKNVGALQEPVSRLAGNKTVAAVFNIYNNAEAMFSAFENDSISYILIPLSQNLDKIISNNYYIAYHFDNLTVNYYIRLGSDPVLNSIVKKYYNAWSKNNLKESYDANNYQLYVDTLGLTELDEITLTDREYNVGIVERTPFENIGSSKEGGIVLSYLDEFSKFSNVEFTITKYKNPEELLKAFNNLKVDLFFNNLASASGIVISTNIAESFYFLTNSETERYQTLKEFPNTEIYVLEGSSLQTYLSGFANLKLIPIKSESKLIRKLNQGNIIAVDKETYEFYKNTKTDNAIILFEGNNNVNYSFNYQNNNDTFYKLFSIYINTLSQNKMTNNGIKSYEKVESTGVLWTTIAKYFLIIVGLGIMVVGIIYASKKKIKLYTKIRKDEKLKFVDMLTSLKNRNYLNEKMKVWNQNTIYPQAIIVIDLNNIKYLNDTFGHEEGDKQIMGAANILHQTQLDNTEIMRTDGNEFMIYLVGYSEKQVVNYLKKLVKEFVNLPYEYGAAFGFSMIVDDLKLIDDAINEATLQMRENKSLEAKDNEEN